MIFRLLVYWSSLDALDHALKNLQLLQNIGVCLPECPDIHQVIPFSFCSMLSHYCWSSESLNSNQCPWSQKVILENKSFLSRNTTFPSSCPSVLGSTAAQWHWVLFIQAQRDQTTHCCSPQHYRQEIKTHLFRIKGKRQIVYEYIQVSLYLHTNKQPILAKRPKCLLFKLNRVKEKNKYIVP